jgi:hypothetical protein
MLSIPQKGRTGNAVMDISARHIRGRTPPILASVVFRIGFWVVDTVNLKSFLWLSRMFLIQSIDEAAVGPCVAYSASYRPVEKCRPQTAQENKTKIKQEFCP